MANLQARTKKLMLNALKRGINHYPDKWSVSSYNILRNAIIAGKIIPNPEKLKIGTPVTEHGVGWDKVYALEGVDIDNTRLIIEIPKHTAFKPEIGFAAYKISR